MNSAEARVEAFRKNVRYFSKHRGEKSMGALEKHIGVSVGYLSRSNSTSIPLELAIKISEYLGIGLDELTKLNARFDAEAKRVAELMEQKEREKLKTGGKLSYGGKDISGEVSTENF